MQVGCDGLERFALFGLVNLCSDIAPHSLRPAATTTWSWGRSGAWWFLVAYSVNQISPNHGIVLLVVLPVHIFAVVVLIVLDGVVERLAWHRVTLDWPLGWSGDVQNPTMESIVHLPRKGFDPPSYGLVADRVHCKTRKEWSRMALFEVLDQQVWRNAHHCKWLQHQRWMDIGNTHPFFDSKPAKKVLYSSSGLVVVQSYNNSVDTGCPPIVSNLAAVPLRVSLYHFQRSISNPKPCRDAWRVEHTNLQSEETEDAKHPTRQRWTNQLATLLWNLLSSSPDSSVAADLPGKVQHILLRLLLWKMCWCGCWCFCLCSCDADADADKDDV